MGAVAERMLSLVALTAAGLRPVTESVSRNFTIFGVRETIQALLDAQHILSCHKWHQRNPFVA